MYNAEAKPEAGNFFLAYRKSYRTEWGPFLVWYLALVTHPWLTCTPVAYPSHQKPAVVYLNPRSCTQLFTRSLCVGLVPGIDPSAKLFSQVVILMWSVTSVNPLCLCLRCITSSSSCLLTAFSISTTSPVQLLLPPPTHFQLVSSPCLNWCWSRYLSLSCSKVFDWQFLCWCP